MLIATRLLCATAQPHRFEAVTATLKVESHIFTAKGKTVLLDGWKGIERAFRAELRQKPQQEDENDDTDRLPELRESQQFTNISASVREGKTTPPKHYTEDIPSRPYEKELPVPAYFPILLTASPPM